MLFTELFDMQYWNVKTQDYSNYWNHNTRNAWMCLDKDSMSSWHFPHYKRYKCGTLVMQILNECQHFLFDSFKPVSRLRNYNTSKNKLYFVDTLYDHTNHLLYNGSSSQKHNFNVNSLTIFTHLFSDKLFLHCLPDLHISFAFSFSHHNILF